ncbi:hypothetical protein BJ875DRAFT_539940 [Amylocarpus encephaloides]|uniref:Uncharacterized protein n=1 Tax=Amylocarpus encephaloides TaxID=45428 RepID=A0A9P8C8P2_9HELO|nr:hypothetical protein BJ875DRAFT_539940 [Amylocarpus encephaloides]
MQSQRGPFAHHTPQETKNAGFLPMVEPSTTPPPPTYTQAPSLPIGTQPPLQTAYYQPYYAPHPELHRNIELQRKRKGKQMKICLAVVAMQPGRTARQNTTDRAFQAFKRQGHWDPAFYSFDCFVTPPRVLRFDEEEIRGSWSGAGSALGALDHDTLPGKARRPLGRPSKTTPRSMRTPGDMRGDDLGGGNPAPPRGIPTIASSNDDAVPVDDPEWHFHSASSPPPPSYQPRASSRDRRSGEVLPEINASNQPTQFNPNPPPQKDPFRDAAHRDYAMDSRYPNGRDRYVTAEYPRPRNSHPEEYSCRNGVGNGTGAMRERGREWTACHKICLAVAIVHLIVIITVVVLRVNYANSN